MVVAAGCDSSVSPNSSPSESIESDDEETVSAHFLKEHGRVIGREVIQTSQGPITRLITTKTKDKTLADDLLNKSSSVSDCISDEREVPKGVGSFPDYVEALRGYVITGIGVNVGDEEIVNFIVEAREIQPDGDFGLTRELFCSGYDCSRSDAEVFGNVPDDYVVVAVGLDNDGTDFDRIDLTYQKIDWNTFELIPNTKQTTRFGDPSPLDMTFSIINDVTITNEQLDYTFFSGMGAVTGTEVYGSWNTTSIIGMRAQTVTFDTTCLQNLPSDGGSTGGGSGGSGGSGFGGSDDGNLSLEPVFNSPSL